MEFNAPIQQVQPLTIHQLQSKSRRDDGIDLGKNLSFLSDYRLLIVSVALGVMLLGVIYTLIATPVYEASILVQVEDSSATSNTGTPKNIQSDLSNVFDIKTATASEMEILRSRAVLTRAVQHGMLYISVQPNYFPIVGGAIARHNNAISNPGLLGQGHFVWGAERAEVALFNVPTRYEDKPFELTVLDGNAYRLRLEEEGIDFSGRVGEIVTVPMRSGKIEIRIAELAAKPGAQFRLERHAELDTVERLQKNLKVAERGKQSGIIAVTLDGPDPARTSSILNLIGREYVRLNVDRKSEKAQKSLAFLDKQLPELKDSLEKSEDKYKGFRNKHHFYDLGAESKALLDQTVGIQNRLMDLDQKRIELRQRYQDEHPAMAQINYQVSALNRQLTALNARIVELPEIEQQALQLSRDVKVNTDLYTSLLGTAQQLRLATSSEVGNARLLDTAAVPVKPVRPKPAFVILLTGMAGLVLGVLMAFVRKTLQGRVDTPYEVEQLLGLPITATIPYRNADHRLTSHFRGNKRLLLLPQDAPFDATLENLRRLRMSLQSSMLTTDSKVIMVTGPTQGVGKTFVSVNFAPVLASIGKKVLLIDADMRAGDLHRYFGMERGIGLSDILKGEAISEQVIRRNVAENVDFISGGSPSSRPAELLTHANFGRLLKLCSQHYDYVLIDTPPVLAASDALVVARHAGVILNVVRGGVSTVLEIEEAVKWLNQSGYTVSGTVFNNSRSAHHRYGYGSRYEKN